MFSPNNGEKLLINIKYFSQGTYSLIKIYDFLQNKFRLFLQRLGGKVFSYSNKCKVLTIINSQKIMILKNVGTYDLCRKTEM
jgi:hypothetical protein